MALNLTTLQPSTFIGGSSAHSSSLLGCCVPKCRKLSFEYTISASLKESRSFPISIDHVTVFTAKPVNATGTKLSRNLSFICSTASLDPPAELELASSDGGNDGDLGDGSGGDGGDSGGEGKGGKDPQGNRIDCILALAKLGKTMADLPADLAASVQQGRIPASIVDRFFELQNNPLFRWLMQFGGFRERLLADDLFLTKVAIECGVGIFTKSAAELERRRENFTKELDFVFADVVMALIADFMLVWLPAPTVSLAAPISKQASAIARFFHGCPDNAFQIALNGTSYSLLQRFGAVVRNGSKLLVVGTTASLVGTGATNALISVRKAIDKNYAGEAEDVPMLPTSLAYGVYMAVSSNLRYQILAGVIEQRILEPLLHKHKLALSAVCFAVRTGNTFLGSLMWVDYARWVGVQKIRSE